MLLKSCAMPPARVPIASSFCDWRSCDSSRSRSASALLRSVMSSSEPAMRYGWPCSSRSATPRSRNQRQLSERRWWIRYSTSQCAPAPLEVGLQRLVHALLVVRVVAKQAPPFLARAHRLARVETEQFLSAGREEERLAAHVPVPHAFVRSGHRELVALLGLAQRLLGALVRIDVADRSRPARRAALRIVQMAAAEAHPAVAAVALANPAVGLLHLVAVLRLTAKRLLQRRLVVRMDVEQREPLVVGAHDDRGVDAGDAAARAATRRSDRS